MVEEERIGIAVWAVARWMGPSAVGCTTRVMVVKLEIRGKRKRVKSPTVHPRGQRDAAEKQETEP